MTTQTLYNQLLNEEITKEQFMYTVRRDERLSQWITNLTSYQDTIKILKNKGAITENVDINKHLSNSGLTSAEKADISKKIKEMGLTGEGEIKKAIGALELANETGALTDYINKLKNDIITGQEQLAAASASLEVLSAEIIRENDALRSLGALVK